MKNQYKSIKILGDKYFLRKTFDIIDYIGDVDGYDVCDENKNFIINYDTLSENEVMNNLKFDIYRVYK